MALTAPTAAAGGAAVLFCNCVDVAVDLDMTHSIILMSQSQLHAVAGNISSDEKTIYFRPS